MEYLNKVDRILDPCLWIQDNLQAMAGIPDSTVDLVYLDPPFNTGKIFQAPLRSKAEGSSFSDEWSTRDPQAEALLKDTHFHAWQIANLAGQVHSWEMTNYLVFMGLRVVEIHRVLKPTGSVFLHCDQYADSYLQLLCDAVFGKDNFKNSIAWCYTVRSAPTSKFPNKYDSIHFYAKDGTQNKFYLPRRPYTEAEKEVQFKNNYKDFDEDGRRYYITRNKVGKKYTYYWDENEGKILPNWWNDIPYLRSGREVCGYPTQKPLKLLNRIISCATEPGDLVLDPFTGCATTPIAAQQLGRRWIGIDKSTMAAYLVVQRMQGQTELRNSGAVNCNLSQGEIEVATGRSFADIERTL